MTLEAARVDTASYLDEDDTEPSNGVRDWPVRDDYQERRLTVVGRHHFRTVYKTLSLHEQEALSRGVRAAQLETNTELAWTNVTGTLLIGVVTTACVIAAIILSRFDFSPVVYGFPVTLSFLLLLTSVALEWRVSERRQRET